MFDVLAQDIKLILYTPDYYSYSKQRGMYIQTNNNRLFETAYNADQLVRKILNDSNSNTKSLSQKYARFDDNCASRRIIDNIIIPKDNEFKIFCKTHTYLTATKKKKILIYPGGFLKNGISTAVINLINNSPEDYHFVCLEFPSNPDRRSELFETVKDKVSIIFKVGGLQYPSVKHYEADMLYKSNLVDNNDERVKEIFKFEYIRNFGHDIVFDAVIDYTGYNYTFNSILLHAPTIGSKAVHLHSNMRAEFSKKLLDGKYRHRKNLIKTFDNYGRYEYICNLTSVIAKENDIYFKEYYGYKKSQVLPNFIDSNKIEKSLNGVHEEYYTKTNKFIYVGRLAVEKNVALLILAFKDFLEDYPNSQLIILGTGETVKDENILIELAGINYGEEIIFMGHLDNPYPVLEQADSLVLFSNHEGQPMVLLEAIALKKKIIASNNAGNRGVLDQLGIHTDEISRISIRKNLENSIKNPEKYQAMDFNARKYDEDVRKVLDQYLKKITERRN
jgi:CDP-glycerol glycerophosphotransferase